MMDAPNSFENTQNTGKTKYYKMHEYEWTYKIVRASDLIEEYITSCSLKTVFPANPS